MYSKKNFISIWIYCCQKLKIQLNLLFWQTQPDNKVPYVSDTPHRYGGKVANVATYCNGRSVSIYWKSKKVAMELSDRKYHEPVF
jgi:hypothetical protein